MARYRVYCVVCILASPLRRSDYAEGIRTDSFQSKEQGTMLTPCRPSQQSGVLAKEVHKGELTKQDANVNGLRKAFQWHLQLAVIYGKED